jgi:hypothetical protein
VANVGVIESMPAIRVQGNWGKYWATGGGCWGGFGGYLHRGRGLLACLQYKLVCEQDRES